MSKLFETDKEKDEHIYKMLGINKWYKWKERLRRRFYNTISIMFIWCVFSGIGAMGYKTFWVSALSIAIVELIWATISHTYYLIKGRVKRSNKI